MARFRERRRAGRVLAKGSAAALLLALTPCLAARATPDAEASRRLDEARHDFENRRFDQAASTLKHLLEARPGDAEAAILLCRARRWSSDSRTIWVRAIMMAAS